jgi:hypothetical protein
MGNVLIKLPQCFSPLSPPHHHAQMQTNESHHSYLSISQVKNPFLLDKIIGIQLKNKKQLYEIIFNVAFLLPVLKIVIWRT